MRISAKPLLRILCLVALGISLNLNVAQLYWLLETNINIDYIGATIDYIESQRDIVVASCNSSLSGGSRGEIIAAVEDLGDKSFQDSDTDKVTARLVALIFDNESLVRVELSD